MNLISPEDKLYAEVIDVFYYLDTTETKKYRVPIFASKLFKGLLPLCSSCLNPDGEIHAFIRKIIRQNEHFQYYILPVNSEVELTKRVHSIGSHVRNSQEHPFNYISQCNILEVDYHDSPESVLNILNNNDCFNVFQSYLLIDRSNKWCLIDIDNFPFTLFFYNKASFIGIGNIFKGKASLIAAKGEFESVMNMEGLKNQYNRLIDTYDIGY